MSAEFGVTSGHSLYSTHRFREDTKHMVIFETLVKTDAFEPFQYDLYTDDGNSHNRTRLYLTEDAYGFTLRMEEKGYIISVSLSVLVRSPQKKPTVLDANWHGDSQKAIMPLLCVPTLTKPIFITISSGTPLPWMNPESSATSGAAPEQSAD